jgi:hypothetical protein
MATIETERPGTAAARRPDSPPRRSHPLTEYWDYRTASWRTRDPVPAPRRGD